LDWILNQRFQEAAGFRSKREMNIGRLSQSSPYAFRRPLFLCVKDKAASAGIMESLASGNAGKRL
jgi:hypothetical protein